MIIDAHVHLYPDKIAARAAQNIGAFYGLPMRYDGSAAQLRQVCAAARVDACVLCSVATKPAQVQRINEFLVSARARLGGAALCALHPQMTRTELAAALDYACANGMNGAKLHPDFQRFAADDAAVFPIYEALAARALPLLLHAGDARYAYSNPARIACVAREFPKLTVVAAHFGGWSEWDAVRQAYAPGYENLYVDTCSSLQWLRPAQVREAVAFFGAERVLFGTDYPMWDAGAELAQLRACNLPEDTLEAILHGNARRVYFQAAG